MAKRKQTREKVAKPLDTLSRKRPRGRPGVRASEVRGRADSYRWILNEVWGRLGPQLLQAESAEEVTRAFEEGASPYGREFMPALAGLVLKVIREPKFPVRRVPQANFLADSLAGRGWISPRRSRDICEKERKKEVHYIVRQDFYIQCTCGYKGPAMHGNCPKCGTSKLNLPHPPFTA